MDEDNIVIPVAALPELYFDSVQSRPRLGSRVTLGNYTKSSAEKALHFTQEALDALALARYWNLKAESEERDNG